MKILKLLLAIGGMPFFFMACANALMWLQGETPPAYLLWLVGGLWVAFVHSANEELGEAFLQLQDLRDRLLRRGQHHPEMWWLRRYPGMKMWTRVKGVCPASPVLRSHYEEWKNALSAEGYGPKLKDPGFPED